MALPSQIVDLADYTESINIMVHADTGAGKTVAIADLPNLLYLAAEEGTISAKRMGKRAKVWRIKHWADLVEAYEYLRDEDHPFEWVAIDSVTSAQQKDLRAIMEAVVEKNATRDPDIPAQGDHFKWQLTMKRMITDFVELPVNVVFLAQTMKREDAEGDDIYLPLIEGKDYQISAWACAQVHLLCHLKKERVNGKVVRRLYTNNHTSYWCKDRYNLFGNYIDNPNFATMYRQIKDSESRTGSEKKAGKPAKKRKA